MAGEEQALLYTLEEISGSDYCLREDSVGGSQVGAKKNWNGHDAIICRESLREVLRCRKTYD